MFYFVYLTTNILNKKQYVGLHVTKNLQDNYLGSGKILKQAIKKYGRENFKREELYFSFDGKDLGKIETQMIHAYKTHRSLGGYNLSFGGERFEGYEPTNKGKPSPQRGKTYEEMYGFERAEELKAAKKLSSSRTEIERFGPEKAKERAEARSKLHKGKKISEEQKRKIIEANVRRWSQHRVKITDPNGRTYITIKNSNAIYEFAECHNILGRVLCSNIDKGIITSSKNSSLKGKNTAGWLIETVI